MMNADFSELRVKMVDSQVRTTDVTSAPLLAAMLAVPREAFVPANRKSLAYIDEHILISDAGQQPRYLMQASPFAKLAQLAEIRPSDTVLDVGTGTGYSAAVFSRLAQAVVALESDSALAAHVSSAALTGLNCDNVTVVTGPLPSGHPERAPYDVIFVGGSIDQLPDGLLAQLGEGGRLVVVEGRGNAGVARLYLKSNGVATGRRAFNAAVKPLPGFERAPVFEF